VGTKTYVTGIRARYMGAAAITIAPEGLILCSIVSSCAMDLYLCPHSHSIFSSDALGLPFLVVCHLGNGQLFFKIVGLLDGLCTCSSSVRRWTKK
jgi:hypothetical protein